MVAQTGPTLMQRRFLLLCKLNHLNYPLASHLLVLVLIKQYSVHKTFFSFDEIKEISRLSHKVSTLTAKGDW